LAAGGHSESIDELLIPSLTMLTIKHTNTHPYADLWELSFAMCRTADPK